MGHRNDLLAGARRCLAEKGFAQTTARDIVAASGTNLASIGYHFGSKEALLNAAIMEAFDDWGTALAPAAQARDGQPVDRLEAFLDGLVEMVGNDRPLAVASVQAYAQAEYSAEVRRQIVDSYRAGRRELAAMLLRIDQDDVDDETARRVGSLCLAVINGLVLQWLADPTEAPSGRDLAAAMRMLVARA